MAELNVTESGTVVMVSTPETEAAMAAERDRLAGLGVTSIVFQCQKVADSWCDRVAAMTANYKAMALALQSKNNSNTKRRAKRKEQAQAA